jgi:hypothetical protein
VVVSTEPRRSVLVPVHRVEDLVWVLGLLEDWLLHADNEVCAALVEFAAPGRFADQPGVFARLVATQLADHADRLRRTLPPLDRP